MRDFWMPRTKYVLLDALVRHYGETERAKLSKMPKKQLYAIWVKLFKKRGSP